MVELEVLTVFGMARHGEVAASGEVGVVVDSRWAWGIMGAFGTLGVGRVRRSRSGLRALVKLDEKERPRSGVAGEASRGLRGDDTVRDHYGEGSAVPEGFTHAKLVGLFHAF